MKFEDVLNGTQAVSAPIPVPGFTIPSGEPFVVLMRPLTGMQLLSCYADAMTRAREKGVTDPKPGDSIYDLALMAYILSIGCVDPDSPANARAPSFTSGIQILDKMGPETIVYLHEHHEVWQTECSPSNVEMVGDAFVERVREVAGPNGHLNFMRFSPSMRLRFAISTARMFLASLEVKSMSGSTSETSGQT